MANFTIEHKKLGIEFFQHLELDNNKRILFSGPFGTGKSTFLRQLFNGNIRYVTLSLNPINYSIGSNQDVFEWIKYDILIELINKFAKDLKLTKEDYSTLLLSQMYILENPGRVYSVVAPFIALSEKVGKPITEILKSMKDVVKDFKTFREKLEDDEGDLIMKYLQRQEASPGSPYEKDALSNLVATLLHRLKVAFSTSENKISTVLIIDDLDRIDPEHMFRLFNVFSAHYDLNDTNKFGFDKVVFVCDVENIRKIFHHRYGTEVDFNGYIDKFYSKEVFDFNNRTLIKSVVKDLVRELPLSEHRFKDVKNYQQTSPFYTVLEWVIYGFIQAREINLRMLAQINHIPIATESFKIRNVDRKLSSEQYPLLSLFKFLQTFFPSIQTMQEKLRRVAELYNAGFIAFTERFNEHEIEVIDRTVATYCLPFLLDEKRAFDHDFMHQNINFAHKTNLPNNLGAEFKYFRDDVYEFVLGVTKVTTNNDRTHATPISSFQLVYEAFKVCKEKGIIY